MTTETRIEFSEVLGRRVRLGSWQDQKISTYRKIREAVAEERWDDAADLSDYFIDEASVCFILYRQWISDLSGFLRTKGVTGRGSRGGQRRHSREDPLAGRRPLEISQALG